MKITDLNRSNRCQVAGTLEMRIFLFIFLLLVSTVSYADPEWEFVRLREQVQLKPSWQTSQGTAQVHIDGGIIQINVFDILGPVEASLTIEGTIDSSGNINAMGGANSLR